MKKILIAIPTNKYVETTTMKAIYDLEIPDGYTVELQFFFGYQIDQIRNLIASWATHYDYLFSVDSDISFTPDTLKKLLSHNKDMVSGLYIQRKQNEHILEVYEPNDRGGCSNIPFEKIKNIPLVELIACGMGCVLIKGEVFRSIPYPHFVYHSAIDHKNTISEDVDFCRKVKAKGFGIFADTTVHCEHIGNTIFKVESTPTNTVTLKKDEPNIPDRLKDLSNRRLLPSIHVDYLKSLSISPKVIYDIGASVLHWTNEAKTIWPNADYILFEAMPECEFLYKENNLQYHIGVLSDVNDREVSFYQNNYHPGGNSYYKENEQINPESIRLYNESNKKLYKTKTLDSIISSKNLPMPDLIKIDVQGAELDVLKGSKEALKNCKDLILELQIVEYNKGAPLRDEVIKYVENLGFRLISGPFCDNGPDGDYHFSKNNVEIKIPTNKFFD